MPCLVYGEFSKGHAGILAKKRFISHVLNSQSLQSEICGV